MIHSPYQTTACRAYDTRAIEKGAKLAAVEDQILHTLTTPAGKTITGQVMGVSPDNKDIPLFSHPFPTYLNADTKILGETPFILLDIRGVAKVGRTGELKLTNPTEYEFLLVRGLLTYFWYQNDPRDLVNLGEIAPAIFTRWLAQSITRRLGLSPAEQVQVTVVALFYWYSLFTPNEEIGEGAIPEGEKRRIITKLNAISSIPSSMSFELADKLSYMPTLKDFVQGLKDVVQSPRMERLSEGLLMSMLGGSWFGFNAKEVVAVALEHPPTFLAILHMALKDRSYKKSMLGTLAYDHDKRGRGEEFSRNVNHLLETVLS